MNQNPSSEFVAQLADALFTGGTSTVEKFTMGFDSNVTGGTINLTVNGGTANLYVGSGGIVKNGTSGLLTNMFLTNGLLGAKADWSNAITVNLPAANTFTIKAADASDGAHNITVNGIVSGSGSFTKTGGGALILTGNNTFTGVPVVSAGTLQGNTNSLKTNFTNNANVTFDQASVGTYSAVIGGSGSFTKIGAGPLARSEERRVGNGGKS